MKPQDLIFYIILITMIYLRNSRFAALAGIICLVISIPLFAFWIFFTAERLIWYAAAFFVLSIGLSLMSQVRSKKK